MDKKALVYCVLNIWPKALLPMQSLLSAKGDHYCSFFLNSFVCKAENIYFIYL